MGPCPKMYGINDAAIEFCMISIISQYLFLQKRIFFVHLI